MDAFVETTIQAIRAKVGTGRVLCALSGGVDSSVAAVLLARAVGKQLTSADCFPGYPREQSSILIHYNLCLPVFTDRCARHPAAQQM